MKSLLHITNGDSFTSRLQSLPLKGDIITWREMLCEGKTLSNVGSESFWKTRFEFLNKNYKISKSWFVEKTLKEYRSLCNHKQQDKIVLWFEYDLFCQINMLAVLSWLKTHRRHAEISLVCSGKVEGSDELHGLGELSDDQLMELYESRIELTQDDIEYADYVWQLYCSDNPIRLENLLDFDDDFQFDYLPDAIRAHLKRFPAIKNGLNALENKVLDTAHNGKFSTRRELLGGVLQQNDMYGYGDTQYDRIITSLRPLFSSFNPVKLTKKGKEVLQAQTNFYAQLRNNDAYLGGALKYSFLYNTANDRILKL
ncbi:DUF1835 domain-containing protein [Allomuricauda sp. SCSIO 65647]|uniref:DUF1835 domain-containing protein n=1 Tax=Allomuricauda sp. SCSIO 65647 TaxID=2908843 RepID=UPI001F4908B7|nr:DUF1835 domain-containing protein [Muricauda sp. SCSIO 65647]UJH67405.1 DUF1835 domain-containing protein [Muricauda sp. SCSIO 65647]